MFEEYAKKLDKLTGDAPKVFKAVANWGAKKVVNLAKEYTDEYELFVTGNYKRNWFAEVIEPEKEVYGITLENNVEYASFLEDGYKIKKDYFVPFDKMEGTPKTKAFIARFKAKYPNAKGFIRKAGKYKGQKTGRMALDAVEGEVLIKLHDGIRILMFAQKYGLTRSEAKKYLE